MNFFDDIVIGQGLAGTALAWNLRWSGRRVLVIDRGDATTASRVAAGLLTPITGKRLVKTWRYDDLFPFALNFYRRVEGELGEQSLTMHCAVRLFAGEEERAEFERRRDSSLREAAFQHHSLVNEEWFAAPNGGFEMPSAGRLDVPRYLDGSRERFARDGGFLRAEIDLACDVELTTNGVALPRHGVRARTAIFCQGFGPANPWFPGIAFMPAKGEILTLRVPGLLENRVVHRGAWLVPVGGGMFRAGATYDRDDLTWTPTRRGREETCARLREFLRLPFTVIGHEAGVRPIVAGGMPAIGVHPSHTQLAYFNGLGSKGSLLAPFFAARLATLLTTGRLPDLDAGPSASAERAPPMRVTDQAHAAVRAVLQAGEVAIDATAGNGRDTVFLAQTVGPTGQVVALDIQPLALDRTAALLRELAIQHVTLACRDHAEMEGVISEERGPVGAVMFNLGHLPGGDKSIVTSPMSTLTALRAALRLLRPGGVLTIVAHPGHPGGASEAEAVRRFLLERPPAPCEVREVRPASERPTAPALFVVRKVPSR